MKENDNTYDVISQKFDGVMLRPVADGIYQCCGCGEIILNPNDRFCRNCGKPIRGIFYDKP